MLLPFIALLTAFVALPSFAMMRHRYTGWRLLLMAPVPGALLCGVFVVLLVGRIGANAVFDLRLWAPTLYWAVPLMLLSWLIGLAFCALCQLIIRLTRR